MREQDHLWNALVVELGEPATRTERGARNATLKELREVGATPDDIHTRCQAYRRMWPNVTLTATALKKHWSILARRSKPAPPSVAEVLNLPNITEQERQENARKMREMTNAIGKGSA